jgi:hypothetical protein
MKKLFALAMVLCLGFVFTVGCTPEKPKDKPKDKPGATAPADKDKAATPAADKDKKAEGDKK